MLHPRIASRPRFAVRERDYIDPPPLSPQLVFYDVDAQTDSDGSRMYEYVSVFGALSSTFSSDTTIVGGIDPTDESYFAINSDGSDGPFPSSPANPGSEALKYVTSFRIVEQSFWSSTLSAPSPRPFRLLAG